MPERKRSGIDASEKETAEETHGRYLYAREQGEEVPLPHPQLHFYIFLEEVEKVISF